MTLATTMLDQLAVARRIIEDGQEIVPAWRIATPEGAYLILTRFDDKPGQREAALFAVSRFMVWKMATSFVLTGERWLGAEATRAEALLTVGVSYHERLAVMQRVVRGDAVSFSDVMWLAPHHVDDQYFAMLPSGRTEITAEEEVELARLFGKRGEFRAERVS
jgi:hypothetical protein